MILHKPSLIINDDRKKTLLVYVKSKGYIRAYKKLDISLLRTRAIGSSSLILLNTLKRMNESSLPEHDMNFYFSCFEENSIICVTRMFRESLIRTPWFSKITHRIKFILPFPQWRWALENPKIRLHCAKLEMLSDRFGIEKLYMFTQEEYINILMKNKEEKSNYPVSIAICRTCHYNIPDIFDSYVILTEGIERSAHMIKPIMKNISNKPVTIFDYDTNVIKHCEGTSKPEIVE